MAHLSLRPVKAPDYPHMFMWYCDPSFPHLWNLDRRVLTFRAFLTRIENMLQKESIQIACRSLDAHLVGYVQIYGVRPWDGWAMLSAYVAADQRSLEVTDEVLRSGIDMAFVTYPLRKLY